MNQFSNFISAKPLKRTATQLLFIVFLTIFFFTVSSIAFAQSATNASDAQEEPCAPTDAECILKIVCPPALSSDECVIYREGRVLAARQLEPVANAGEDTVVLIGDEVVFSALKSEIPPNFEPGEVEYWWNFGDLSTIAKGVSVPHSYAQEGNYTADLVIKTPNGEYSDSVLVTVAKKAIFLIVGENQDAFQLTNLLNQAHRLDFLVYTLSVHEEGNDFAVEDHLIISLLEHIDEIRRSEMIIGFTKSGAEINALIRFGKQLENKALFNDKQVVIAAATSIGLISRRTQPIYDVLHPQNVIVVAPSLLENVLEGERNDNLISSVQAQGKNFALLGIHSRRNFSKLTFYNFLSHFINLLINQGVSINTILLILMLPLVATIVSFARQVIGIKSFGVYIPSILTITFVAIGIHAGLLIMVLVLVVGTLMRLLLKRFRLLYLPRMALMITSVSFAILALFYFSVEIPNLSLLSVSIFPILILIMLVEEFIKVQMEEGGRGALILTAETIFLSVVCFYIVRGTFVRNILLSYPEIILLSFIVNFGLGKWSGLRLWEYYRFNEVIKAMRLK